MSDLISAFGDDVVRGPSLAPLAFTNHLLTDMPLAKEVDDVQDVQQSVA
jgi:hypothetical protein